MHKIGINLQFKNGGKKVLCKVFTKFTFPSKCHFPWEISKIAQ